jgi:hypothetical protein
MRSALHPERIWSGMTEIIELPWPLRIISDDNADAQAFAPRLHLIDIRGIDSRGDHLVRLPQDVTRLGLTDTLDEPTHTCIGRLDSVCELNTGSAVSIGHREINSPRKPSAVET